MLQERVSSHWWTEERRRERVGERGKKEDMEDEEVTEGTLIKGFDGWVE